MNLNQSQREAVAFRDGSCFCIAGPGSGKTSVIINRVHALVEEAHVLPGHILVVTFTKAAANEMKQRYLQLSGQSRTNVTFSTFHSLFFRVLQAAYGYRAENIIKEETKYQFMRDVICQKDLSCENENEFVSNILEEISLVKNKEITPEHYYAKSCGEEVFREVFACYNRKMQEAKLIDFDDMQSFCRQLFVQRPDILKRWQQKYRYLMVDEFQDIDLQQYEILKLLAGKRKNVFAVGDDDQSIYRFRGANPEICFRFLKEYENTRKIELFTNYRSTKPVVELSQILIRQNKKRFRKQLQAKKEQGAAVVYRIYKNQYEEAAAIINELEDYKKTGGSYDDTAILFRTNRQPGLFAEKLMEYNIPYRLKDHIPNLFEHWIAKDMITYLKIACGSRKRSDFYRIMNRPNRYLSRAGLESAGLNSTGFAGAEVAFDVWREYYEDQDWMCERIEQLEYDLKVLSRLKPKAALNYIRNTVGYETFLQEYASGHGVELEELYDVWERLSESAGQYETYEQWFLHMEEYKVRLQKTFEKREIQEKQAGVTLSTLHAAKGLEYEVVFIVDINEGIIPYKKAVLQEEIEEERRLLYVGMTRAKSRLYLSSVRNMQNHEAETSGFIREMGFLRKQKKSGKIKNWIIR